MLSTPSGWVTALGRGSASLMGEPAQRDLESGISREGLDDA